MSGGHCRAVASAAWGRGIAPRRRPGRTRRRGHATANPRDWSGFAGGRAARSPSPRRARAQKARGRPGRRRGLDDQGRRRRRRRNPPRPGPARRRQVPRGPLGGADPAPEPREWSGAQTEGRRRAARDWPEAPRGRALAGHSHPGEGGGSPSRRHSRWRYCDRCDEEGRGAGRLAGADEVRAAEDWAELCWPAGVENSRPTEPRGGRAGVPRPAPARCARNTGGAGKDSLCRLGAGPCSVAEPGGPALKGGGVGGSGGAGLARGAPP